MYFNIYDKELPINQFYQYLIRLNTDANYTATLVASIHQAVRIRHLVRTVPYLFFFAERVTVSV